MALLKKLHSNGHRTFQPRIFQPQASTLDFSILDFSTMNSSTPDGSRTFQLRTSQPQTIPPWTFQPNRGLGLRSSCLKRLGLRIPGLKHWDEKSGVGMSCNSSKDIIRNIRYPPATTRTIISRYFLLHSTSQLLNYLKQSQHKHDLKDF